MICITCSQILLTCDPQYFQGRIPCKFLQLLIISRRQGRKMALTSMNVYTTSHPLRQTSLNVSCHWLPGRILEVAISLARWEVNLRWPSTQLDWCNLIMVYNVCQFVYYSIIKLHYPNFRMVTANFGVQIFPISENFYLIMASSSSTSSSVMSGSSAKFSLHNSGRERNRGPYMCSCITEFIKQVGQNW